MKDTNIIAMFKKVKSKTILIIIGVVIVFTTLLIANAGNDSSSEAQRFAVIETVATGTVSSGIETTGTILAAQKLDLNIYKQTSRIGFVNVASGSHVTKGTTLFSFDRSSANVAVQSAQVSVAEAELSLQNEQNNYSDGNTAVQKLEQEILDLEISIQQTEQDKVDALKKYLNADLDVRAKYDYQYESRETPVLSGYYNSTVMGEYSIRVYGAASGLLIDVSGLSSPSSKIVASKPIQLGSSGLEITFSDDVKSGDAWVVSVPNKYNPSEAASKNEYEETLVALSKKIIGYQNDIENKLQSISDEESLDSTEYRDLEIAQAEASLAKARVQLSENYEIVSEQSVIAPFSGTIEGLENVVVGATPSGGTEDPISFGTLISDEFLVTFSLGAVDVSKIELDQKVLVTVTSFSGVPVLEARITEISSLPESSGLAQYEVQALVILDEGIDFELREGLLVDIEIIEEEVIGVLRIPRSAITYINRKATVDILDTLPDDQQKEIDRLGILRSAGEGFPTYPVEITIGLEGAYYVEVLSGLEEGQQIISSKSSEEEESIIGGEFSGGGGRQGGSPAGI